MSCPAPTAVTAQNKASCESLESQLANFVAQLFGSVTKTEADGKVTWALGCGLQTGLELTPRGVDEGIACYFFRLVAEAVDALEGEVGEKGDDGENGNDGFALVQTAFSHPAIGEEVDLGSSLLLSTGLFVFVAGSGYYQILSSGLAKLLVEVGAPDAVIAAGSVIVLAARQGTPVTGPQGLPGEKGDKGAEGEQGIQGLSSNPTSSNGMVSGVGSGDFFATLPDTKAVPVKLHDNFVDIILPRRGKYLIVGTTATLPGNTSVVFLQDMVTGRMLDTTHQATWREPRMLNIVYGVETPRTIRLFANADNSNQVKLRATATTLCWSQIG